MNPRLRITVFSALATLLGSLSLLPIYDTYGWLPRVVLMVVAGATTSALANRVRALSVVTPLLMVAVWLGLLTLLYAHQVAPLGIVPGPGALRVLHDTLSDGFNDTTQLAAPVPITRGLSLMTTGGIGLVAVVVETLTTGLRRPAVAGLPLLAIFTVPAAILNNGVGWQPFVFASAGYLALLLADGRDRITRWGRPVRATRTPPVAPHPLVPPARVPPGQPAPPYASAPRRPAIATNQLTSVGRRIGAAAIGIAVVVPVIIPGLHSGWFGTHHTNGAGIGSGRGATSISPIVTLRRDLQESAPTPLFSYTTTGTPDYLRMLTLDQFDGEQWTPATLSSPEDINAAQPLPPPANVAIKPARSVTTDITVSNLKEPYLPVPMMPTAVQAKGDWRYNPINYVVYSKHSTTSRLRYEVNSAIYQPTQSFLNSIPENPNDPSITRYLATPNVPAVIQQITDQVIADAQATTPYEKAVALQSWFHANFRYDIHARSGSNTSALESFLLTDRTGFCEQFAAAMALMARLEGIPSRVDVGFTPGSNVPGTNTYIVTTADAHAWPELYFPGAGWLRFEPTPRDDGQTTQPVYTSPTAASPGPTTTAPANTAPAAPAPTPHALGGGAAPSPSAGSGGGGFSFSFATLPIGWIIVLLLLALILLSAPGIRWRVRRRRWGAADTDIARAHAAWQELDDDLRDLGLEWRGAHDSPRRAAAALLATRRLAFDPIAQEALSRLARAEELARYASPRSARLEGFDPQGDERAVRRGLYESVPLRRRLRARLAPPSTGRVFAGATAAFSDAVRGTARRVADAALAKLPAR